MKHVSCQNGLCLIHSSSCSRVWPTVSSETKEQSSLEHTAPHQYDGPKCRCITQVMINLVFYRELSLSGFYCRDFCWVPAWFTFVLDGCDCFVHSVGHGGIWHWKTLKLKITNQGRRGGNFTASHLYTETADTHTAVPRPLAASPNNKKYTHYIMF